MTEATMLTARGIAGLRVLIVGGSGGIGSRLALALAREGASLVLHGRDRPRLEALAALCREANSRGPVPGIVSQDLSSGEAGEELVAEARSCDALVLAFGPFLRKPLAAVTQAEWRSLALTDLALPGFLASTAAAAMAGRGFGRILFFGGTRTETVRGFRTNAAYAAAKTGLGVVAKSLSSEFAAAGVSCAVLCPGFVETEYQDADSMAELAARSPRGRMIPAEELARTATWLLAGGMDLCNGAILNADEGLHAL